jgi:putative spermidine/putrescine transport system permease protein
LTVRDAHRLEQAPVPTPAAARPGALLQRSVKRLAPRLMLLPALVVVGLLAVGFAVVLDNSLRTLDRGSFRLGDSYSLDNYRALLATPLYRATIERTLAGAALTTIVTVVLALPYAYLLVRTPSSRLRKLLLFCLFMPFFIGQVVRAYSWIIVFGRSGFVNTALGAFDVGPVVFLYNLGAVVFGLSQYLIPTAVLLIAPALVAVGRDHEDASANLGADWVRTLRHVVIPMARPGIAAAATVVFAISVTDFAMPAMMGGGRADFVANLIYGAYLELSDPGLGAALSVVLVAIASALLAPLMLVGAMRRSTAGTRS